jgi:hypothetical protein
MEQEYLIQGYLNNSLSPKDQKKFDELLNTDPKFKESFQEHYDMHRALYNTETTELKRHLKDFEAKLTTQKRPFAFRINKFYFAGAAAILLVALAMTFYTNKNVDYYEEYFTVYPNVYQPIVRGDNTNNQAFQAYENGNYLAAIEAFNASKDVSKNPNLQFYLAQSYLATNNIDKAEFLLKKLSVTDFEFQVESKWYLSLIYLKNGEISQAKKELTAMNGLDSDFKFDERTLILQKLDTD